MSQTRTHHLEGRKRERVGELGNVACHKRGLTSWWRGRGKSGLVSSETWHVTNGDSLPRGEEGGGAGVGELGSVAHHKRGLTNWREERRSGMVSVATWHVTNEDSLAGREEEGGADW